MPWVSRLLRGERVFARATASEKLQVGSDGRVDVVYNRRGGKVYRAAARNLLEDPNPEVVADDAITVGAPSASKTSAAGASSGVPVTRQAEPAVNPVIVYADGACSGNPGPAGIGVVILDGRQREEISEYLGTGTNNIAELTAIIRALERSPRERSVILHSDSAYALGLLGKNWKAKANPELVARMRAIASTFHDLRLVKVEGHAGIVENERADALAREAVSRRR